MDNETNSLKKFYKYYKENKTFDGFVKSVNKDVYTAATNKFKTNFILLALSPIAFFIISNILVLAIMYPLVDLIYSLTSKGSIDRIICGIIVIAITVVISAIPSFLILRETIYTYKYLKYIVENHKNITYRVKSIEDKSKYNIWQKCKKLNLHYLIFGLIIWQASWYLDELPGGDYDSVILLSIVLGFVLILRFMFKDYRSSLISAIALIFIIPIRCVMSDTSDPIDIIDDIISTVIISLPLVLHYIYGRLIHKLDIQANGENDNPKEVKVIRRDVNNVQKQSTGDVSLLYRKSTTLYYWKNKTFEGYNVVPMTYMAMSSFKLNLVATCLSPIIAILAGVTLWVGLDIFIHPETVINAPDYGYIILSLMMCSIGLVFAFLVIATLVETIYSYKYLVYCRNYEDVRIEEKKHKKSSSKSDNNDKERKHKNKSKKRNSNYGKSRK